MDRPQLHRPRNREEFTLRTMAKAAREAGETWTMQKWARELAAKAGHKDYRGQLAGLYKGVIDRWRYVQEPEETVMGTGRAVLANTLGLGKYGGDVDVNHVDVAALPLDPTKRGTGDCDEVATLVAAGVHALGMRPFFRVVRSPDGGHVSVTAQTATGERVELDPVGHPNRPFGWALSGPEVHVRWYAVTTPGKALGSTMDPAEWDFLNVDDEPYFVAPLPGDAPPGGRILTMPDHLARQWARPGVVVDETPAVDQYGDEFVYDADSDLFLPQAVFGAVRWGRRRSRRGRGGGRGRGRDDRQERRSSGRRGERVRRRRRMVRRVRKVAQPVLRAGRRVGAKLLDLQVVQQAIASSLAVTGTPVPVTMAMLRVASGVLKAGGLRQLLRKARSNPREAARFLASAVAKGRSLQAGLRGLGCPLGSVGGHNFQRYGGGNLIIDHGEGTSLLEAAPATYMIGMPGMHSLGSVAVSPEPMAGSWYRIRKGDNLLKVAGAAFPGESRLPRAQSIAAAKANAPYLRPSKNEFEKKHFPAGLPSFNPQWASDIDSVIKGTKGNSFAVLWIPPAPGIEPPVQPDAVQPTPPIPTPIPTPPMPTIPLPPGPGPTPAASSPPIPAPPGPPVPPKGEDSGEAWSRIAPFLLPFLLGA